MQRRTVLQLTGTAMAATVGTGHSRAKNRPRFRQQGTDPIEFEDPEELLLEPGLLPGDGWEENEGQGDSNLDVSVVFSRQFEGKDEFWIMRSAAAGRDTDSEASDLYDGLSAAFSDRVGDARIMDLDLASEAAIAGYDGRTKAIFRDVNCVGFIEFADCTRVLGCSSHVARTESLVRTKRQSWRETPEGASSGREADDEEQDVETESPEDDSGSEFVDEIGGQATLAYGETARVSIGVETTVYEGTLYDQMGDEVPEDRERFLVIPVEAESTSDEPRIIPDQTDSWEVLFGNQQVGNVFRVGALTAEGYEPFEGGEVQEGVHREGVLLFEVDAGFDTDEFEILWQDDWWVAGDVDGAIDVRWSADG